MMGTSFLALILLLQGKQGKKTKQSIKPWNIQEETQKTEKTQPAKISIFHAKIVPIWHILRRTDPPLQIIMPDGIRRVPRYFSDSGGMLPSAVFADGLLYLDH